MSTSAPSRTSPRRTASTPATNRRTTNGSVSASQTIAQTDGRSTSWSSFGPDRARRSSTAAAESPRFGSTPRPAATSAPGRACTGTLASTAAVVADMPSWSHRRRSSSAGQVSREVGGVWHIPGSGQMRATWA